MEKKWRKRLGITAATLVLTISTGMVSYAEDIIHTTAELSLTIHKYEPKEPGSTGEMINGCELAEEQLPTECTPLSGVTFEVYEVASDTKSTGIPQTINMYSGETENANPRYTETTDENGEIHLTNLAEGRYLVVETNVPMDKYEKAESFLVDVPMMNRDGNGWIQDVHIYSKSASVLGAVVLTQLGEGTDSMKGTTYKLEKRAGQVWDLLDTYKTNSKGKITVKDLARGEYRFVQESVPEGYGGNETPIAFRVNENYKMENGSLQGAVELSAQAYRLPKEPLTMPDKESVAQGGVIRWTIKPSIPKDIENYTKYMVKDTLDSRLTYLRSQVMLDGEDITNQIGISYTKGTLTAAFPQIIYGNMKEKALEIIVETSVNSSALDEPGDIPNEAELIFNSGWGEDISKNGNPGNVFTGNLKIFQYAGVETPLSGGVFAMYESKETAEAGSEEGRLGMNVATDKNGEAMITGLAEGTYWLKEVEAPMDENGEVYILLKEPIKVEFIRDKATAGEVTIAVKNIKTGLSFSDEGNAGPLIFVIIGLLICGGSTIVLEYKTHKNTIRQRRKSRVKARQAISH